MMDADRNLVLFVGIALAFSAITLLHRRYLRDSYFPVYAHDLFLTGGTFELGIRGIFFRGGIAAAAGVVAYLIWRDDIIVAAPLMGFLFAYVMVWPGIVNVGQISHDLQVGKLRILTYYGLFVVGNVAWSVAGASVMELIFRTLAWGWDLLGKVPPEDEFRVGLAVNLAQIFIAGTIVSVVNRARKRLWRHLTGGFTGSRP